MSINSKMTAIANPIRSLTGKTDQFSLDAMVSNLNEIVEEVDVQNDLIQQILTALQGKASGDGSEGTVDTTAALDSAILDKMILE